LANQRKYFDDRNPMLLFQVQIDIAPRLFVLFRNRMPCSRTLSSAGLDDHQEAGADRLGGSGDRENEPSLVRVCRPLTWLRGHVHPHHLDHPLLAFFRQLIPHANDESKITLFEMVCGQGVGKRFLM